MRGRSVNPRLPIVQILAALLLAALAWGAWAELRCAGLRSELATLGQQHAKQREQLATAQTQAVEQARTEERRTNFRRQETLDADHLHQQAVQAALRRSDAAARSLRDQLAVTRAAFTALVAHDSAASEECRAAAQAGAVCTDLLGQCSERRRELALFAEGSASAGAVCVGSYRALIPEAP